MPALVSQSGWRRRPAVGHLRRSLTPLFKQTGAGRSIRVCNLKAWEVQAGGLPNIQGWHGLRGRHGLRELAWHTEQ